MLLYRTLLAFSCLSATLVSFSAVLSPLTESLTIYQYTSPALTIEHIKITSQSFTENTTDAKLGETLTSASDVDALSGHVLSSFYGPNKAADETDTAYNGLGQAIATTYHFTDDQGHPISEQTTMAYQQDANGTTITVTHPNLLTHSTAHYKTTSRSNALGQKLWRKDNLPQHNNQPASISRYNDLGQLACQQDIHGLATCNTYDAAGRKLIITQRDTQGDQVQQFSAYDDVANTLTTHGEATVQGQFEKTGESQQTLNAMQKVMMETQTGSVNPAANADDRLIANTTYNNWGLAVKRTANLATPSQTMSSLRYDALGEQQTALIAANTADQVTMQVNFHYDLGGKLTSKSLQAAGETKTPLQRYDYLYNGAGELQQLKLYTDATDHSKFIHKDYVYTDNGYTVSHYDFAHQVNTTAVYRDILGKKTLVNETVEKNGKSYSKRFHYDMTTGRLLSSAFADGHGKTSYQYRPDGLLLREIYGDADNPAAKSIDYDYYTALDNSGYDTDRLKTHTDIAGLQTHYDYDNFGRRSTVTLRDNSSNQQAKTRFDYHPLGEVWHKYRYQSGDQPVDTIVSTYDAFKNPKTVQWQTQQANGAITTREIDYTFLKNGNLVSKKVSSSQADNNYTLHYGYDNVNHVINVQRDGNSADGSLATTKLSSYYYDLNGNRYDYPQRSLKTGVTGLRIGTTPLHQYVYNDQDQLTQVDGQALVYDHGNAQGDGNLTQDTTGAKFDYNAENQLTQYTDDAGVTRYDYLANGLRASKTQGGTTLRFYYEGKTLSNTVESSTEKDKTHDGWVAAYFNDGSVSARLLLDSAGKVQKTQFYNTDNRGSVLSASTVAKGKITRNDTYQYTADGAVDKTNVDTNKLLSLVYNPRQFGAYTDQESGMQYHQARYVRKLVGMMRFITRDFGVKLMNRYGFDEGDAVNLGDPSGHNALNWRDAVSWGVGAVTGFLAAGLTPGFGLGVIGDGALSGALGGLGTDLGMKFSGTKMSWGKVGLDAGVGALIGGLEGLAVARHSGLGTRSKLTFEKANQIFQENPNMNCVQAAELIMDSEKGVQAGITKAEISANANVELFLESQTATTPGFDAEEIINGNKGKHLLMMGYKKTDSSLAHTIYVNYTENIPMVSGWVKEPTRNILFKAFNETEEAKNLFVTHWYVFSTEDLQRLSPYHSSLFTRLWHGRNGGTVLHHAVAEAEEEIATNPSFIVDI